jgi:methylphosphotriester-DNA--protein-cysteine methyltransferase
MASSPEQHVLRLEEEREEDARREAKLVEMRGDLRKLRDVFEAKKDATNVVYLDQWMAGTEDPATMAENTGRDPAEFHLAQKRRKRVIERFLAEKNGVPSDDEENE